MTPHWSFETEDSRNLELDDAPDTPNVTAVLNVYRRPEMLQVQIDALSAQSRRPDEILIWVNGSFVPRISSEIPYRLGGSGQNEGVWARFRFAQEAKTDFVCVLDDDTIPGSRWLENCLSTFNNHPGLIGTRGLRFGTRRHYAGAIDVGWRNPNSTATRVDIAGHSWFFPTDWLHDFWECEIQYTGSPLVGEDIHFSFVVQRLRNLPTVVPPHPKGALDLWGSHPLYGWSTQDERAISHQSDAANLFQEAISFYVDNGFRIGQYTNVFLCLQSMFRRAYNYATSTHVYRQFVRPVVKQLRLLPKDRFRHPCD